MFGYDYYRNLLEHFAHLLIGRLGTSVVSVVLYGSVARGSADRESDIDILVILEDASPVYYERLLLILQVELHLRRSSSYQTLKEKSFASASTGSAPTLRTGPFDLSAGSWHAPYFSFMILTKEEAQVNRFLFLDMIEEAIILHDTEGFFRKRLETLRQRLDELGAKKVLMEDGSWYWDLKPDLRVGEVFTL